MYYQRGDIPSLTLLLGLGDPKTLDLKIVILFCVGGGVWQECLEVVIYA